MLNKINIKEIENFKKISSEEKNFRLSNLNYYNSVGLPNKTSEDWKFSDLKEIFSNNFEKFKIGPAQIENYKINLIKNFEHNYIIIVNGEINESNFKYEEKSKINFGNFKNKDFFNKKETNPLINLNFALSDQGYFLKIEDGYKMKKALVVYNVFTENLKTNLLNFRNEIVVGKNSELHTIELLINNSNQKIFNNVYEKLTLKDSSIFKNIYIQNKKNAGFFHKFLNSELFDKSSMTSFLFPSGAKFNKFDLQFDLKGKNIECNLKAATLVNKNEHQEIKTKINHLHPSCKSYQKVKTIVDSNSKGVYQGKIYVKDIAQKTDAYQLSKAILLDETSEFDSKPELEIYADDVKCSHGSTSGKVDEDSIHYLMTRGLNKVEAIKLLVNGFLDEIVDTIKSETVKNLVRNKIEEQLS